MTLPVPVSAQWPERAVLDAPGGFCWWYCDVVFDDDTAMVLIVAYGLPFLPGYASAARAGRGERPIDRPAIALSVIERGRLGFWTVTELRSLDWSAETLRSELGAVEVHPDRFALRAELAGEVGGAPWSVSLAVDGAPAVPLPGAPAHAEHEWRVLSATASATATFTGPEGRWTRSGRAYVDRNACPAPLHAVGPAWHWGRLAHPDGDVVWYAAEGGEARAVRIDASGRTTALPPPHRVGTGRGRWGQPIPRVVAVAGGEVELTPVDDSPFYTRFLARGTLDGAPVAGIAEWCVPDRIDARWVRPLVRMAVVPPRPPASIWLPLLAGPASGRLGRLLRGWWA